MLLLETYVVIHSGAWDLVDIDVLKACRRTQLQNSGGVVERDRAASQLVAHPAEWRAKPMFAGKREHGRFPHEWEQGLEKGAGVHIVHHAHDDDVISYTHLTLPTSDLV